MAQTASLKHTPLAANVPTFCTSLRKRREWETLVPILLKETPKWRESRLETHDVAMPVTKSESPSGHAIFRFILLSQVDVGSDQTEQRLNRLAHLTGGINVAVIFLLGDGGNMSGFMQLQLDMMDKFDMRLLPLYTVQALPTTLAAFIQQLSTVSHPSRPYKTIVHDLLSYSTLNPHLTEHKLNLLSDITSGFKELASKAATEEGKAILLEYLGEEDAQRVIDFWMFEYAL